MNDGTPPRARRGLRRAAADLAAALLGLGRTRLELVAVEFEEVRARTSRNIALVMVAALCFAFAILAASLLVVVLFWDTYRLIAAGGVTLLYLGIGAWALARLREMNRNSPPAFSATLQEFASDLRMLRGHDE